MFRPPSSRCSTPAWLREALDDIDDLDRIVTVEEVDASQTLAQKVRFRVAVEDADGTRRTRTYCVKAHLDGSPGADLLSEARFYGELAPQLDVRMPRRLFHRGRRRRAASHDHHGRRRRRRRTLPERARAVLTRHRRDTLGQLARLHAATWGCAEVADLTWLSPRITGMADIFPLDALQALLDDGRGPDIAPELRSASNVAEAMRRTGAHEITCVIHADPHSGNSYLDAEGRACWLDWQIVQRGNWATDISYHLATVLDIETRRTDEAELLRHYLRELESLGAPAPPWDEAWEQYTLSFSYGYFLWVITRISSARSCWSTSRAWRQHSPTTTPSAASV